MSHFLKKPMFSNYALNNATSLFKINQTTHNQAAQFGMGQRAILK
jgi:hypothetical protein